MNQFDQGKGGVVGDEGEEGGSKRKAAGLVLAFFYSFFYFGCSDKRVMTCKLLL